MIELHPVQHVKVKIFAREPVSLDLADAIPVFHSWIQDRVCEELLIDVADYRHVAAGPGVMLIAHEANYSLDNTDNRLGLLYNRKAVLTGSALENLQQAYQAAVRACRRLEQEIPFRGKLEFDEGDCEVTLNDRLLAPNNRETYLAVKPELEKLFGGCALEWMSDPRELFRVRVKSRDSEVCSKD
jgi:hypothetical protein